MTPKLPVTRARAWAVLLTDSKGKSFLSPADVGVRIFNNRNQAAYHRDNGAHYGYPDCKTKVVRVEVAYKIIK